MYPEKKLDLQEQMKGTGDGKDLGNYFFLMFRKYDSR